MMKKPINSLFLLALATAVMAAEKLPAVRPPSVPLIACDPYFSVWSPGDRLTDTNTVHWTGKPHRLTSLIRVDGQIFRLMGSEPAAYAPLPQSSVEVLPTRTIYVFRGAGIEATMTFLTPALPEDLELCSWPVTYLTWEVKSVDGKSHEVSLYYDQSAELAVNKPDQEVVWAREKAGDLDVLKIGSKDQPVLGKRGDDLRIDWGYLYLAVSPTQRGQLAVCPQQSALDAFINRQNLAGAADAAAARVVSNGWPVAALAMELGTVIGKTESRSVILAYDDLYSIQYFKQNLKPFWRRHGMDAAELLKTAFRREASLAEKCRKFDAELMADLRKLGGEKYARICALAFRQTLAGNKIAADANGQPLLFPKENFSNGCIGTVDVIYPMAPFFLLFGPSATKAMLVSNFDYAQSPRWKFPFAPHDLGQYPHANGQRYGGGERTEDNQMPVEETGNMLILVTALAQMEGHADFAGQYWSLLVKWAEYLKAKGFDPENQLCTDDFAGHLAHNVNLSAKAIVALGAFGKLCNLRGEKVMAAEYKKLAREFAERWIKEANDGDHFRLAFDKPNTWSQKYNLVWDRILGLNLFPAEVLRKEMDFYKKTQARYALALDNRKPYTKLDWTLWTATLTGKKADFDALVGPAYDFLNATPDRVPMTDWYWVETAKKTGFQARPVVGGVYLKFLYDASLWKKWARRDLTKSANWAPFPTPPKVTEVVPTAQTEAVSWRFTFQKPADNWPQPDFDASSWKTGPAGFGTKGTPGSVVRTEWRGKDIWLRREFELSANPPAELSLLAHHDEDVEIYLNGVLAASASGFISDYEPMPIRAEAQKALKAGRNVMAIHCRQTTGGQYVDCGLVRAEPARP